MKYRYKIIFFSLLFLGILPTFLAAQVTIKGRVRDAESGEDLVGATIVAKGVAGGTLTNYEGAFVMKVEALPVTIKISYTGTK